MGEQRSYERVANEFSVAPSTVKLWARSFGWQERLRERDLEIARQVADRTVSGETDRRERSLQIVRMALVQLAKAIAEGDLRMTLSDLDKLIRLEAFLSDEAESRHELVLNDLRGKTDSELRAMIKGEIEVIAQVHQRAPGIDRPVIGDSISPRFDLED